MHGVPCLAVLPPAPGFHQCHESSFNRPSTSALYKTLMIERQSGISQTATSMLTSGCVC